MSIFLRLLPIVILFLIAYFLTGPTSAYSLNDPLLNVQNQDLSSGNLVITAQNPVAPVAIFNWLWLIPLTLVSGGLFILYKSTEPTEHYEFTSSPRYDIAFHDIYKDRPDKKAPRRFKKKLDKIL